MAIILLGGLALLPTIVAACKGHDRTLGIFLINVFFGWTIIGWIIALVWAFQGKIKII